MKKYSKKDKKTVINLRKEGLTYFEIKKTMSVNIPKSTMSTWCKGFKMSDSYKNRVKLLVNENLTIARKKSIAIKRKKKQTYMEMLLLKNKKLGRKIEDFDVAKIALAVLYLGEGKKGESGALVFGNSNPDIIKLFLKLLRYCYKIDELKFRCTVQCRFDQNIAELEVFWQKITKISPKQFYKAQVDSRTKGKPSKKKDYKGVCRIDYFSADIFWEIKIINEILVDSKLELT